MNDKNDNKLLISIIYFFINVPTILVSAFCLMKIWNWFIPLYFDIRELDMTISLGLGFVSCFFRYSDNESFEKADDMEDLISKMVKNTIIAYIKPIFILVIAFIVKIIAL
jgi:hypothetical protein